jgi:coenzyme F420-dependent glucose-6-phosphate dehydrogenase
MVEAFHRGGGRGKPMFLQVHLSYAGSEEEARSEAYDQWRTNILDGSVLADLRMPEQFDRAAEFVRPDDLEGHVRISTDLGSHAEWLRADLAMGFSEIYLHNVGRDQRRFLETFGKHVLPALK